MGGGRQYIWAFTNQMLDNPLSQIIAQVQSDTDENQILPKKKPSFIFRWVSAMCSCFGPEEIEFRSLNCDASCEVLLPPQSPRFNGMKTLVLDLDETLVHSSFKPTSSVDMIVPFEIEGKDHCVFVGKRPGVDQFLAHIAHKFEVVIFTASVSKYADPLIDKLDSYSVVSSRLFRESCVQHGGSYVKDLTKLGRELSQTMIIDNSPNSYKFQPENAIPIRSWFDDPEDNELIKLLPILDQLAKAKDVETFRAKLANLPSTPITPTILDVFSDDTTSIKESSARTLKSTAHSSVPEKIEGDRSDLNSPMNKQGLNFQFEVEDEE